MRPDWNRNNKNGGRIFLGTVLAVIGLILLLKALNLLPQFAFSFHFGWPLILVAIGLFIGIKSNFRNHAWWILLLIGGLHVIVPIFWGDMLPRRIIWPSLLIAAGLIMILRKQPHHTKWIDGRAQISASDADSINMDISFAGRKEIVTSRSFRGGLVRASFAGAEINLTSADSDIQPMVLEIHANFAGIEIIVPSHWDVQNEINPTMGSVEDHRIVRTHDASVERRMLILRGSCSFGSVEVKSY